MAERKTYTSEDFKGCDGRRVLVEGTIYSAGNGCVIVTFEPYFRSDTPCATLPVSAIREILPEEIKVGDRVRNGVSFARVLALHDGRAWVLYADGRRDDWDAARITLVERGQ